MPDKAIGGTNKMTETKYILELDEKQANILQGACEFYARVRMGQWGVIPRACVDLRDEDYCGKVQDCTDILLKARKTVYPELMDAGHSYGVGKFEDGDMAWELYEVVRHCQAWHNHPEGGMSVCFDKPMCFSGHKLAKCTATEAAPCKPGDLL